MPLGAPLGPPTGPPAQADLGTPGHVTLPAPVDEAYGTTDPPEGHAPSAPPGDRITGADLQTPIAPAFGVTPTSKFDDDFDRLWATIIDRRPSSTSSETTDLTTTNGAVGPSDSTFEPAAHEMATGPSVELTASATRFPTTPFPTVPTTPIPTTPVPTTSIPTAPVPTTPLPTAEVPTTRFSTAPIPVTTVPTTPIPTTRFPTTPIPITIVSAPTVSTATVPVTETSRRARRQAAKERAENPPIWMHSAAPSGPVKYPHDWRWFVGGLGRVFISLGLLIFAFVAYQLWGTGIQYQQSQDKLKSQFEELVAAAPPPVTVASAGSATPPTVDPADPTATLPAAPNTAAAPPVAIAPLPTIELGQPIALMEIPAINLDVAVVAGVRTDDLRHGVGHFPASPFPGQPGNVAMAGHRTTWGQPFFNVDKLVPGDDIILTTIQGLRYVYKVTGQSVVEPSDGQVVANQPDRKMLTLTSCTPKFSARHRIVITADLDEAASSPMTPATSNYLDPALAAQNPPAPVDTLPGDSAEVATTIAGSADAASTTTVGAVETSVVEETAATNATLDTVDAAAGTAESLDQLQAGWFSDPKAWPQVALWGAALFAIALLAWRLSRKVHRNWVGALVGIAPFVLVLYYFFENVNRLLPPNL